MKRETIENAAEVAGIALSFLGIMAIVFFFFLN